MLTGTDCGVIDGFHISGPLSAGGMGQVWLAEETGSSREVVLKTVRPDLVGDDDVELSFRREIDVTARLHHEHVVRHVAHGRARSGIDYLALQRIRGVTLFDLLRARPALSLSAMVGVATDIAAALAYVHELRCHDGAALGLVHADVSPQNILIDRQGCATLIDFGAVVTLDTAPRDAVIGKPSYLSPEQSRGAIVDARTDQYALGIVLWEMIAGRSLFEGNAKRRGREVPPLGTLTRVPFMLDAAVMRMLAYDADARFPDCRAAAAALAGALPWSDVDADRASVGALVAGG